MSKTPPSQGKGSARRWGDESKLRSNWDQIDWSKRPVVRSVATIMIATPETDARLRFEWMPKGRQAYLDGQPRLSGPSGGKIGEWWIEGWDEAARLARPEDQTVDLNAQTCLYCLQAIGAHEFTGMRAAIGPQGAFHLDCARGH